MGFVHDLYDDDAHLEKLIQQFSDEYKLKGKQRNALKQTKLWMFKETYGYLMSDAPHAVDFFRTMRAPGGESQSYSNPTAGRVSSS